jgi:transposase
VREVAASEPPPAPRQKVTYERAAPKRRPTAEELYSNLPVDDTVTIIPDEVQADPDAFEQIGEERTFEVDISQPKLYKREIVRPKYRRKDERAQPPVVAPAPVRFSPGGHASTGLVAWVILSKYVDHLPLYRLEKITERYGARIPRQSMVDWIDRATQLLAAIHAAMWERLRKSGYLQVDETPVQCRDPDAPQGSSVKTYLWVASRPGDDVVFFFHKSRSHDALTSWLGDYEGLLQTDAYAVYPKEVAARPGLVAIGCWAHARRYFFEAQGENPAAAGGILTRIASAYRLEREWDQLPDLKADGRAARRREHLAPVLDDIKAQVTDLRTRVRPTSLLGKACEYLLGQWKPLRAVVDHGQVRIDNNLVENAIRPSAIGKKNWLFIGHPDAGQRSAILYSIVVSCQRHRIDPAAYLRDVLGRLPAMTNQADLTPLLPGTWQPARRD